MIDLFEDILDHKRDPREQIEASKGELLDWAHSIKKFRNNEYDRNSVFKIDETNEVVLACWRQGHLTPFHKHPGQSCWIYMIEGELEETLLTLESELSLKNNLTNWSDLKNEFKDQAVWKELEQSKKISSVTEGQWNYIDDKVGFHSMRALGETNISLHLYRNL